MNRNVWKTLLVFLSSLVYTQAWLMKCFCNFTYYDEASCGDAGKLVNGPCFYKDRITYFYTFGLNGTLNTQGADKVREAMINTGDRNVCFIDWEQEASLMTVTGTPIDNAGYFIVAQRCVSVGKEVGTAIVNMINAGMDREKTHCIGHSLGAHLMGSAGVQVIEQTGVALPRITGCDPARPGFDDPLPMYPRISPECAECVDVVRTDPGHYGIVALVGHMDISVNLDEYKKNGVQPGCPQSTFWHPITPLSTIDYCSHRRCVDLLVESISYPCHFPATKAPNLDTWIANDGAQIDVTYTFSKNNTPCSGKYFFSTNENYPYGRGIYGLKPRTTSSSST